MNFSVLLGNIAVFAVIGIACYLAFRIIRYLIRDMKDLKKKGVFPYSVMLHEEHDDGRVRPVSLLKIEAHLADLKALKIAELEAKGVALPPLSGDADFSNRMQLTARRDGPPSLN